MKEALVNLLFRAGIMEARHRLLGPRRLTVFAYHRVADPQQEGFTGYRPNVSATPEGFARQLDYIQAHFQVVAAEEVILWLHQGRPLPPYPALLTFDDGYRDNLLEAAPLLQQRKMPAILFLATAYIGSEQPFFWDLAAACFRLSPLAEAELPLLGRRAWADEASREKVTREWVEGVKRVPHSQLRQAVAELPASLRVSLPPGLFAGLHLTWDEARSLADAGISLGSHTENHPIMTRVPFPQAQAELRAAKERIEAESGQPVSSFAFPNGSRSDFNLALQVAVFQAGYRAGYTLLPGPARLNVILRQPFAIQRIFVSHLDNLPRFAAKSVGLIPA